MPDGLSNLSINPFFKVHKAAIIIFTKNHYTPIHYRKLQCTPRRNYVVRTFCSKTVGLRVSCESQENFKCSNSKYLIASNATSSYLTQQPVYTWMSASTATSSLGHVSQVSSFVIASSSMWYARPNSLESGIPSIAISPSSAKANPSSNQVMISISATTLSSPTRNSNSK